MTSDFIQLVRETYQSNEFIPLHEPRFRGDEKKYLEACIDSGFVSSVGEFVNQVEKEIAVLSGSERAVACVNGTSALHAALEGIDVGPTDEVITQAFTFVATGNAISYTGAKAIFVDISEQTLGMSPSSLREFLEANATVEQDRCINKQTGKRIAACIPMHTFGFPCEIMEIAQICDEWHIPLIEDAAESLGSYVGDKHTGTFGHAGTFSFNGNKVITCGGGGFIITDNSEYADLLKHITTTAKVPHSWDYVHDRKG
ncbi:MAG: DegT/DnrJ/EryC1/StrS family aminotransferase, partial [Bacteroidota bacterium]